MVTTGRNDRGYQDKTEVLDLSIAEKFQCQVWPDYPMALEVATIGLLGNKVLVCGGYDGLFIDECYSINAKGTEFVTKMSHKREYAASVNINEDIIWISGGYGGGNYLSSSEFMTVGGSMAGPELPIPVSSHEMVAIDNDLTMVIGGYSGSEHLAQTFYYDHSNEQWVYGPILNQARHYHAAGTITDEATMDRFVVISGGYDGSYSLKSTEILQDGDWSLGILLLLKFFTLHSNIQ